MNGRSTIIFPLIVLGLLAFITFWINNAVKSNAQKVDGSNRHDVDYFIENFVTTKTDLNGNLRHMLAASEMRHYPDNDSTELVRPRFTQFGENKPYTQIEGQKGLVSSNGEVVEFKDNVVVVRQAFEGRGEMRLSTNYLKVCYNEVEEMDEKKRIIHGTGMIYDKSQKTFTLLKNVRVHYEKPNIKSSKPLLPNPASSAKVNPIEAANKIAPNKKAHNVKKSSNSSRNSTRVLKKK